VLATVHPSAVLRATAEERSEAFAGLVADLQTAREAASRRQR
jgi:uracil-DNA glycosylase